MRYQTNNVTTTTSAASVPRVISYARVSTSTQAETGLGVEAQHQAVQAEAERRGWSIVERYSDNAVSGSLAPHRRPRLSAALEQLRKGGADKLASARLDRLIRSSRDLQDLLDIADRDDWELISLDVPSGAPGPVGVLTRSVLGAVSEFERALVSERTAAALAVAKSRGQRLGRPSRHSPDAKRLATAMHAAGASFTEIANALAEAGLPTATGKRVWQVSSVKSLLCTVELDEEAKANAERYAADHQSCRG
ncbi:recombinase family protein [Candidatus Poriferisodalis sp.]|uniref:recombinase family protein n=1 Tax=Candidatus Poriferisodalis sp. TaxID=3101277 RepID=UPI003B01F80C